MVGKNGHTEHSLACAGKEVIEENHVKGKEFSHETKLLLNSNFAELQFNVVWVLFIYLYYYLSRHTYLLTLSGSSK